MRKSIVVAAAGLLLAIPLVGYVQQVPEAAKPPSATDLVTLVSAQTKAINALNKRIVELEKRVKALEETAGPSP
jgi:hypothetical protein